jgi:hypothetical protein
VRKADAAQRECGSKESCETSCCDRVETTCATFYNDKGCPKGKSLRRDKRAEKCDSDDDCRDTCCGEPSAERTCAHWHREARCPSSGKRQPSSDHLRCSGADCAQLCCTMRQCGDFFEGHSCDAPTNAKQLQRRQRGIGVDDVLSAEADEFRRGIGPSAQSNDAERRRRESISKQHCGADVDCRAICCPRPPQQQRPTQQRHRPPQQQQRPTQQEKPRPQQQKPQQQKPQQQQRNSKLSEQSEQSQQLQRAEAKRETLELEEAEDAIGDERFTCKTLFASEGCPMGTTPRHERDAFRCDGVDCLLECCAACHTCSSCDDDCHAECPHCVAVRQAAACAECDDADSCDAHCSACSHCAAAEDQSEDNAAKVAENPFESTLPPLEVEEADEVSVESSRAEGASAEESTLAALARFAQGSEEL